MVAGGENGISTCTPVYSEAEISMEYSGDMSTSKPKMSVGTLSVNATFEDGTTKTLSSYSADSGPSFVGSIPNGDYTASSVKNTSEEGMVRDGVGFKVILSNNTEKCRTDLRIHPDGEAHTGTAGCIGLTESATELNSFKSTMNSVLPEQNVNVNVNITANPNYSDCDKNGKKKTKGGAAGN